MARILLVEDNIRLAALVRQALSKVGIQLDAFTSMLSAMQAISMSTYDAMIIDRSLPDGDGVDLIKRIRSSHVPTPCLILTARDAIHDRITGLESGADDYLTKPFAMDELVARVRALIRRSPALQTSIPVYGDLQIQPDAGLMKCNEQSISLPATELQILLELIKAEGKTVRRSALEQAAWGLGEAVTPNALDVALHRIRKKLLLINSDVDIQNVRGHGYALHTADH